jgi:hypothetical protein
MWDVSSALADSLFAWSNVVLIVGAAAVLIGTIGAIKMAAVREHFADLRISENERSTAHAMAEAATARETTEKLRAANLALEAQIQPRRLSGETSTKLIEALSKMQPLPIGIVSRLFDPEGADFANDISNAFVAAHWQAVRQTDWTMSNRGVAFATFEGTVLAPELANALLAVLDSAKIKATVMTIRTAEQNTTSAHFQPNTLYLLVGAKP